MGMLRKGEDGVFTLAYPVGEGAQFPLVDIDADMGMLFVSLRELRLIMNR
jgi:hypothetical protein